MLVVVRSGFDVDENKLVWVDRVCHLLWLISSALFSSTPPQPRRMLVGRRAALHDRLFGTLSAHLLIKPISSTLLWHWDYTWIFWQQRYQHVPWSQTCEYCSQLEYTAAGLPSGSRELLLYYASLKNSHSLWRRGMNFPPNPGCSFSVCLRLRGVL